MISVLLPTRGRLEFARRALMSLQNRGSRGARSEFLVRVDGDDSFSPGDYRYGLPGASVLIEERHGYERLHLYYNELAEFARGEWLLLWNDDARMRTPGWDKRVREALNPSVPAVGGFDGADYALFPVVTHAFYEALGHFSQSPHCDSYIVEVARQAGCFVPIDGVQVDHLRDTLDDETKREGERAQVEVTSPAFYSPEMSSLIVAAAEKVRAAMAVAA